MTIHPILKEIARTFNSNGKELYLVGGAVRDGLMGKKIHDWDAATNALPQEVIDIIRGIKGKVIPTGLKHGTVTVIYKQKTLEITTFRTESDYTDGRRPDNINFARTIEEDLSRRDFTMNAIALHLPSGKIVDPFCGKDDISAKIIRCVGSPLERFSEDGLRSLRAVRFSAKLNFQIETETLNAIPKTLSIAAKVSKERVRDEIEKILFSPMPSTAFLFMEKTGLLELFLPELYACRGIEQKGFHKFDVLDHCLFACDYAAQKEYSYEVRLSALLHDIGKPKVRKEQEGGCTFYRHEEESFNLCKKILKRLKFSNAIIDSVCHLVKEHMFHYTDDWTDAALRRFIVRIGQENLQDIFYLRKADAYAFSCKEASQKSLLDLKDRIDSVLKTNSAFTLKDLAIGGNDLMAIGIPGGKTMGIILNELLETVLDDPAQNTKDVLLGIAKKLYEKLV